MAYSARQHICCRALKTITGALYKSNKIKIKWYCSRISKFNRNTVVKTVFSCCWNVVKDIAVLADAGRLFQACDAATENARSLKGKKGKGRYRSSWELHLRATGRHLPYGITQCYLPPDTSERAPPNPSHAGWYSIYLPWRDRRLS